MEVIAGRKTPPREGSYTTYLFEKGRDKILKKVGENGVEVLIGGAKGDRAGLSRAGRSVLSRHGADGGDGHLPEDVVRAIRRRHVIDKKVKQERMQ